jgi:transposase
MAMINAALTGIRILDRICRNDEVILQAELDPLLDSAKTLSCPNCQAISCESVPVSMVQQDFLDIPDNGKRQVVRIQRTRLLCRKCGGLHSRTVPALSEHLKCTERFVHLVFESSLCNRFANINNRFLLSPEKTLQVIQYELEKRRPLRMLDAASCSLGFEIVYARRKPFILVLNADRLEVMEIIAGNKPHEFDSYLKRLSEKPAQLIRMDTLFPFRRMVLQKFAGAIHVMDAFHISRLVDYCVDNVYALASSTRVKLHRELPHLNVAPCTFKRVYEMTKRDRIVLESWGRLMPLLIHIYKAKEDLLDGLDKANSSIDARESYQQWKGSLSRSVIDHFRLLTDTVERNNQEVFGYFDAKNDAYQHLLKRITAIAMRAGIDFELEIFPAKMLNLSPDLTSSETLLDSKLPKNYRTYVTRLMACAKRSAHVSVSQGTC